MFGNKLKELRINRGMSQEQLGNMIGVTKGNISSYETGRTFPREEKLRAIAKIFNVSFDYLLGDEQSEADLIKSKSLEIIDEAIKNLLEIRKNFS